MPLAVNSQLSCVATALAIDETSTVTVAESPGPKLFKNCPLLFTAKPIETGKFGQLIDELLLV